MAPGKPSPLVFRNTALSPRLVSKATEKMDQIPTKYGLRQDTEETLTLPSLGASQGSITARIRLGSAALGSGNHLLQTHPSLFSRRVIVHHPTDLPTDRPDLKIKENWSRATKSTLSSPSGLKKLAKRMQ
ncbi:hypothetical protein E2C01_014248 [Portunus trituberculatus]|uniref:Uncharacterized protein n=1 Tax=Portunus trituberculatus TaxID=210409 RepID=A0A5B7DJA7_PORTR|nr:hypothetical protein [Portunus trituberculatus]